MKKLEELQKEFGLDEGVKISTLPPPPSTPRTKEDLPEESSFWEKAWSWAKFGNDVWTAIGFAIAAIGFLVRKK